MNRRASILPALALAALSSAAASAAEPLQRAVGPAGQPGLMRPPSLFTFQVPVRLQAMVEGTRAEVRCDVRQDGRTLAAGTQEVMLDPNGNHMGSVTVSTAPLPGVRDLTAANNYYCWLILHAGGGAGHAACPASAADCPSYARIKPDTPSRTGVNGTLR
jgi:hypothetical protein